MTPGRTVTGLGLAAALAAALTLHARDARAYTFMDEVPEDPCAQARSFDPQDGTLTAQKARRACRLAFLEQRMASERAKTVASEEEQLNTWVEKWFRGTQPARVIKPMAIEVFGGSGIATYGLVFSWTVLRQVEIAARLGQRKMTCPDESGFSLGGDCTRTTWNVGARYFLGDRDFVPFLGAGFSSTSSALAIFHPAQMNSSFEQGRGRADSLNASAGVQLAVSAFRLSVEYVFEYLIYTGANVNDIQKTPSEDLRLIWEKSLNQDKHGIRFQVGFAF